MGILENIDGVLGKIQKYVVLTGGTVTILIILAQVIFRYVLKLSMGWYSDLIIIFYMWSLFTAFAYTQRLNRHVSFSAVADRMSPGTLKTSVDVLKLLSWLGLALFFIIYGIKMVQLDIASHRVTSYFELPYSLINASVPVCGIFISYTSALRLWNMFASRAMAPAQEGK